MYWGHYPYVIMCRQLDHFTGCFCSCYSNDATVYSYCDLVNHSEIRNGNGFVDLLLTEK